MTLFISVLAAYALARLQIRGRDLILSAIIAVSTFPLVTLLVPLFEIMRALGLLNTWIALILPYTVLSLPVCTLILVSFFEGIPRDLENSAMIDGCTRLGALFKVVVPLSAPGVFTAGILAFVNAWDEFLLALSFNSNPMLRTLAGRHHALSGRVRVPLAGDLGGARRRHRAGRGPDRDLPGACRVRPDLRRHQGIRIFEMTRRPIGELRSQRWYASDDMRGFAHRQRTQQMGLRREEFLGKPVVAIVNTWSDLSPCHSHLRDRAEAVKRGVWQAGGYPVELPALSVGEVMVKPTTMLYRNFLAMEVEELLRSHPIDGAVLLGGCDKSTPGLLMGAISMDIPVIYCPAGPMSNGQWRGQKTGAGTHTKKYWDELRAGNITQADWVDLESRMTRSIGTCNTMGTASTMTSIVDAMGLTLPGASSIPAADSGHPRMASACGERIVEMIWEDLEAVPLSRCPQLPQRSCRLHGARAARPTPPCI